MKITDRFRAVFMTSALDRANTMPETITKCYDTTWVVQGSLLGLTAQFTSLASSEKFSSVERKVPECKTTKFASVENEMGSSVEHLCVYQHVRLSISPTSGHALSTSGITALH